MGRYRSRVEWKMFVHYYESKGILPSPSTRCRWLCFCSVVCFDAAAFGVDAGFGFTSHAHAARQLGANVPAPASQRLDDLGRDGGSQGDSNEDEGFVDGICKCQLCPETCCTQSASPHCVFSLPKLTSIVTAVCLGCIFISMIRHNIRVVFFKHSDLSLPHLL
jgi:hypothetical protein